MLGETTNHVEIQYEVLLDPNTEPILPRELLNDPPFSTMHWDTQMSGVQIPDNVVIELDRLWENFKNVTAFTFPEEVDQVYEDIFE